MLASAPDDQTEVDVGNCGRVLIVFIDELRRSISRVRQGGCRRWAGRKYKRLRTNKRYRKWLAGLLERQPGLFTHWRVVRTS